MFADIFVSIARRDCDFLPTAMPIAEAEETLRQRNEKNWTRHLLSHCLYRFRFRCSLKFAAVVGVSFLLLTLMHNMKKLQAYGKQLMTKPVSLNLL